MTDSAPPPAPVTMPIEHWEALFEVAAWLCVATRVLHRWPAGRHLSQGDYEAGLERARSLALG